MTKQQATKVVKVIKIPLPIMSILGFVFIYLKVTEAVDWSWLWVLAPFWIPATFVVVVLGGFLAFALLVAVVAAISSTRY